MTLLGKGIYSIADVAHLTRISGARLRAWIRAGGDLPAVVTPSLERFDDRVLLTFVELVELLVAGQLRELGFSMQQVRRVHSTLRGMLDDSSPFAHQRLKTAGKTIFAEIVDRDRKHLIDVLERQHVIVEALDSHLKSLEYDPTTHLAARWHIAEGVVVDPQLSFGKPVLVSTGISTGMLAHAVATNKGDKMLVAAWYEVALADVERAVEFETNLAA